MAYKDGKVDMAAYGANTSTVAPVTKEGVVSKRRKLAKKKVSGGMK
jgi:hypothetical protein